MSKKQKRMLWRIGFSAVLLGVAHWLPLEGVWCLPVFLIPYAIIGWDILWRAARNIINGQVFDENFLMALATVGALCIGEYAEASFVMLFYQVGEWFQSYAVGKSRRSISDLMDICSDYANLVQDEGIVEVDPAEISVGDIIVVKPGEKVPLDGVVIEGQSSLNTAALTGESLPRDVVEGDQIISGCINLQGLLKIRVTQVFEDSTVAKVLELVENSATKKAKTEAFITKLAKYYTPAVVVAAMLLAVVPSLFTGRWGLWIYRALNLLVVSCPCALVISIPLSFFGGIGGASRHGILVKGSNYLEALAKAETVVMDKTGTLTKGNFRVTKVVPCGISGEELVETAALAEIFSTHPIAVSLRKHCDKDLDSSRTSAVKEIAGYGISALVDGQSVAIRNEKLMRKMSLRTEPVEEIGSIVYVGVEGAYCGYILIADEIKEDAVQAVETMKHLGIRKTVMLTGDQKKTGMAIAATLRLDEVKAELMPADKVAEVQSMLQAKRPGTTLVYVGDGINDAPVLTCADVGIAMGAFGSDAAVEAADIVLMDDKPSKIALAIRIAQKTRKIVWQNIVFALGVKGAVLLLSAIGITSMGAAIFADVGVAVIAILNATRALQIRIK